MDDEGSGRLDRYRRIRAGIQAVLAVATDTCTKADLARAMRQLGLLSQDGLMADEDGVVMLADIALFEPNRRGRRAYDRFLASRARRALPAEQADLAERMGAAWFSIFRVADRHALAGLWLEDLLAQGRRIWIVDEGLSASASLGDRFGMRLFDAGPFHAGFGIVVPADEETIGFCLDAQERGARLPFRQTLAATLYADALRAGAPWTDEDDVILQALAAAASGRRLR